MISSIKPRVLRPGDTIGLISPAGPLAGMLPHRTQAAIKNLEAMGLKVRLSAHALGTDGYVSASAQQRAADLMEMFRDPGINAIMAMIGGYHSNQLLKHLDFAEIAKHPKIFIGFSDITVLHWAIHARTGLVTFYGPAALPQFGDHTGVDAYTLDYIRRALFTVQPIGKIEASTEWTDEFLDWFKKADLERPRRHQKNSGHEWWREGKAEGLLLGGCITSLLHLRGTEFWPDLNGKIFFWEIPESAGDVSKGEPLSRIDSYLTDLELSGVFDQCAGMVIGRPKGYSEQDRQKLRAVVLERTHDRAFPILANIDIGHTDPMVTLPLGVKARMDSQKRELVLTETATQ